MPRGGARSGAGRKKNSPNKATQKRQEQITQTGSTPLDVMIENMRFAHERGTEVLAKIIESDGASVDALKEMIGFRKLAQECAKDAAPYVHPRLAAVEHTGKDGKDLIPDRAVTPFEMARYMAFVLEQAASRPKANGVDHPA